MTKKDELRILILTFLLTVGILGGGGWWLFERFSNLNSGSNLSSNSKPTISTSSATRTNSEERLSAGEKRLILGKADGEKQTAIDAIASGKYPQAVSALETYLKSNRNDPEALIYLNNARIGKAKSYAIGAAVPIGTEIDIAKEILRGVAQAQNQINATGGINGVPLKVIIADDDNKPEIAQQVAQTFVNQTEVLGVVGHASSNATLAGSEVYEPNHLVVISPMSTSVELSGKGKYIFRTVPSDRFTGTALAKYMLSDLNKQKAAVFFNSKSNYSKSLKDVFTTTVFGEGGDIASEYDLADANFNAGEAVREAKERGAQVLMLASDTTMLDRTLQILQANNAQLPLLGGDDIYTPQVLQIAGSDGIGMVLGVSWHILSDPNAKFPKTASQLWGGDINWRTAMAYDAAQALIAAIQRNPTRKGIQEALSASDFSADGAAGEVRFLASGDRNKAALLVTIKKGDRSGFGYDFVPILNKRY
jgi:branched-chain amino acid transport system substrate-binding protein